MSRATMNLFRRIAAVALGTVLVALCAGWPRAEAFPPKDSVPGDPFKDAKDKFKDAFKDAKDKFKDALDPASKAKTDPLFTVKVRLVPLPEKTFGGVRLLRGRKDMFVLENFPLFPKQDPETKQQYREMRLTRYDLRNGKDLGSCTLRLPTTTGNFEDISPDGGLLAVRNFAIGMDLAVVSLSDGKLVAKNYRPSYTRKGAGGEKVRVGACALRFLDSRRWMVLYEDGAVDVWTDESGWKRKQIRAGNNKRKEGFPGTAPQDFCVSNDSKTVAFWNGASFDLIDTTTGEARGKTSALELQADETGAKVSKALFSPDGTHILARLTITKKRRVVFTSASFPVDGKAAPVKLDTNGLSNVFWWGNKHVFQQGNRKGTPFNLSLNGVLLDAATGKALADVSHAGFLVTDSPDGKLSFLTETEKGASVLVQCLFPKRLVPELQRRGADGKLPVLLANKDGLGIKP